jgi:hypothetical protein
MTMPAGWKKNTSTKMTLVEFLKNQKEPSFEFILANLAIGCYSGGEKAERAGPAPYIPTSYNFRTGERILEPRLTEMTQTLAEARYAASGADDEFKEIMSQNLKTAVRGSFAVAYILFWKLYRIAPYISDLPQCMEQCLTKLGPVGPKDILQAAADSAQYFSQSETQTMVYQIISEYSKMEQMPTSVEEYYTWLEKANRHLTNNPNDISALAAKGLALFRLAEREEDISLKLAKLSESQKCLGKAVTLIGSDVNNPKFVSLYKDTINIISQLLNSIGEDFKRLKT